MGRDVSKAIVAVITLLLLFVSIAGTWIALTSSDSVTSISQPEDAQVTINVQKVTSPANLPGQVNIHVSKGG